LGQKLTDSAIVGVVLVWGRSGNRFGSALLVGTVVVMIVPVSGVMCMIPMMVMTVMIVAVMVVAVIRGVMPMAMMIMRMSMVVRRVSRGVALAVETARIVVLAERKVQRLPAHDLGDIDEQHDDGEYRSHGTHITDDGGKRTLQLVTVRSIATTERIITSRKFEVNAICNLVAI
jgi:hypothetical protein